MGASGPHVAETSGRRPRSWRRGDWLTIVLVLASLAAAGVASTAPIWSRETLPSPWIFWHGVVAGIALLVAGLIGARTRSARPIARLILVSSLLYFAQYAVFASSDVLFTLGQLLQGFWAAVAAHALLAFPDGRVRGVLDRAVLIGAYAWATLAAATVLFVDPAQTGCADCPRNLLLVRHNPAIVSAAETAGSVVPVVFVSLIVIVLILRWRSATRPERRVLQPVFATLVLNLFTAIATLAAFALHDARLISTVQLNAMTIVAQAALLLIPIGLAVSVLRIVVARSAVGNLLVRIGQGRTIPELEHAIGWVLGDPSVRIAHPDDRRRKRPDVAAVDADRLTIIEDAEPGPVAIIHDPGLTRYQPKLLAEVTAAARLALDHRRQQADATLSRSVPPVVAERLLREGDQIGEPRTLPISVVMSDIRGYATIAEEGDLHTLASQLNEHRAAMNQAITARRGVVMQFVGDAVFAMFGAPDPLDDHPLLAVRAAVAMQHAQRELNERWRAAGRAPFRIGIGVTTGQVAAGLHGSSERVEYAVEGDVVNLAQRLQGWAADNEVVLSEETAKAVGGLIAAEQMPPAAVKGGGGAMVAYRIKVGPATRVARPARSYADTSAPR